MPDLNITALDGLNTVLMIATIVFGAIGYLKPRFTLEKLDLQTDGSPLGLSEIRAANGALFVGLGAAALFIATPISFAMVGFAYAGAALGRITSIFADNSGAKTSWIFFMVEVAFAALLIGLNLTR